MEYHCCLYRQRSSVSAGAISVSGHPKHWTSPAVFRLNVDWYDVGHEARRKSDTLAILTYAQVPIAPAKRAIFPIRPTPASFLHLEYFSFIKISRAAPCGRCCDGVTSDAENVVRPKRMRVPRCYREFFSSNCTAI